ncbi:hypothetical protein ACK3BK_12035 [Pseudomonas sp. L7]|uniref:hypothetical protein n=1 Tax=Pseudomonas sp. L7 TaxID=3388343 RepID=UPI003984F0E3
MVSDTFNGALIEDFEHYWFLARKHVAYPTDFIAVQKYVLECHHTRKYEPAVTVKRQVRVARPTESIDHRHEGVRGCTELHVTGQADEDTVLRIDGDMW